MKPKIGYAGSPLHNSKRDPTSKTQKDPCFYDSDKQTGRALVIAYLILIIIFSLSAICSSFAQLPEKGLQLHDTIPGRLWNQPLPVINHPDDKSTITLGDYEHKLIILDFWASWCAPCITSLHALDTLQRKFGGRLLVLPVDYEPRATASAALTRARINLPSVISDTVLSQYFLHRFVPHQVWIYKNKVLAITSHSAATAANIEAVLKDEELNLEVKNDIVQYSISAPLYQYAAEKHMPVSFSSAVTAYIPGLGTSEVNQTTDSLRILSFNNRPLLSIYKGILNIPFNRIILRGTEAERYTEKTLPPEERLFCFQLLAKPGIADSSLYRKALSDLNFNFSLNGHFEEMPVECFILKKGSGKQPAKSSAATTAKGAGKERLLPVSQLVQMLNSSLSWLPRQLGFIEETGFSEKIKTALPIAALKDPEVLAKELHKANLTVTRETRDLKMFVIGSATARPEF